MNDPLSTNKWSPTKGIMGCYHTKVVIAPQYNYFNSLSASANEAKNNEETTLTFINNIFNHRIDKLNGLTNLRELNIQHCVWTCDDVMCDITQIQTLERLNLSNSKVRNTDVKMLSNLPNLEELNLSQCSFITGIHLNKIKNLKKLIMSQCPDISRPEIAKISQLEELDLSFSLKSNDKSDVGFIKTLLNLRKLNLSHNIMLYGFKKWDKMKYPTNFQHIELRQCILSRDDYEFLFNLRTELDCEGCTIIG